VDYFFSDYAHLMQFLSGVAKSNNKMDEICRFCHRKTKTSVSFPDGMPGVLFYCLQAEGQYTKEKDLPVLQNINGVQYQVYAYSLYHHRVPICHYTTVLYDEGNRMVFDGLNGGLQMQSKKKLSETPVVGVCLIKYPSSEDA
jgi:hypothetical protein